MKKIFVFLMSVLMIIGLASCGNSIPADSNDSIEIVENIDTEETNPKENNVLPINEPVIVVDDESCTFIVNEVVYDEFYNIYGLKVYLENKINDDLMFAWDNVSVNGYMCDPWWASEVAPGKKENTEIYWLIDSFNENNIDYTNITNIEFNLRIYSEDEETWNSTYYVDDTFALNIA